MWSPWWGGSVSRVGTQGAQPGAVKPGGVKVAVGRHRGVAGGAVVRLVGGREDGLRGGFGGRFFWSRLLGSGLFGDGLDWRWLQNSEQLRFGDFGLGFRLNLGLGFRLGLILREWLGLDRLGRSAGGGGRAGLEQGGGAEERRDFAVVGQRLRDRAAGIDCLDARHQVARVASFGQPVCRNKEIGRNAVREPLTDLAGDGGGELALAGAPERLGQGEAHVRAVWLLGEHRARLDG